MQINHEILRKACKVCTDEGATVLYKGGVNKLHDTKKGFAKRILVITDLFITYFKEKSKPVEERKHYWRDVTSFNFIDEKIELQFGEALFRFMSSDAERIAGKLMEIFLRCFANDELALLDLSRYAHPPINANGPGVLNRLNIIMKESNFSGLEEFKKHLYNFLQYSFNTFTFLDSDKVKHSADLKIALETLRAVPYLNVIELPKFHHSKDLFAQLEDFIKKSSNVYKLSFKNKPEGNFKDFAEAVISSKHSNLSALAFNDVDISSSELDNIKNLVKKAKINSLSFGPLPEDTFDKFIDSFLSDDVTNKLLYLNLDSSKNIRIESFSDKLSNLAILSFANCNLEISKVLPLFSKSNFRSLRYLNLSDNSFSNPPDAFFFPSYLERIDVSGVQWGNNVLPQFLFNLFNQPFRKGLRFHIDNIKLDDKDDWNNIFHAFDSISKYPLAEFSWCQNPVSESLFNFLARNSQIKVLFFNQCFDQGNESEIQWFANILPNFNELTHLVVRGDQEHELQDSVSRILNALVHCSSLRYIDFSDNNIHSQGVNEINELVKENSTLTHVSFDHSNMEEADCLNKMIESGENRRKPLFISWPLNDIDRLNKASKLQEAEIDDLKQKLHRLSTGITREKTNAIRRASIHGIELDSPKGKSGTQKSKRRGSIRDIRGGSFRGGQRPNLLLPDYSPMEIDPNSPLNQPFETYISSFTNQFPSYLDKRIDEYITSNPIIEESDESSQLETESEIIQSQPEIEEKDLSLSSIKSNKSKKNKKQKEKKHKEPKIEKVEWEEEEEEKEYDIIKLSLLKDPDIPFIPQLSFPPNVYKYINPDGLPKINQLNISTNSKLKPLNLPKLQLLGRAPPLMPVSISKDKNIKDYSDLAEIDKSSMNINEETKELSIIKDNLKTEELSDFSSSMSDDEEIEELVGEFPDLLKPERIISEEESEDSEEVYRNKSKNKLPDQLPTNFKYESPIWGFPIDRPIKNSNHEYISDMFEDFSLTKLVSDLEKSMNE